MEKLGLIAEELEDEIGEIVVFSVSDTVLEVVSSTESVSASLCHFSSL